MIKYFFKLQGRLGDAFMDLIEPIAANFPYMVLPGNHEYLPIIGLDLYG